MKKSIPVIAMAMFFLLLIPRADAASKIGAGIFLGEPQGGLTLRVDRFPVIGLGWSILNGKNDLRLTVDYWFMEKPIEDSPLFWYWGLGGKIGFHSNLGDGVVDLGARVPIGLQWFFAEKWEAYVEAAPGIRIFPSVNFWWDAAIGIRYYF